LTILFLGLPLSALDQHKTYLQDQYPAIKKIHETKAKSIRKLIEKIIHEAKIKNIPPVMVNEFLTLQKTNFKTLEKWCTRYKIREFELIDNIFELLRNDFSHKILTLMLEKKDSKNFRQKFAKTLYFYVYYTTHDLLDDALQTEDEYDFKNQDISLIAYGVFKTNPPISYLNDLIMVIQKLKQKKIDIDQSTQIIFKQVLEKKQPQIIYDSIIELPEDDVDSNY